MQITSTSKVSPRKKMAAGVMKRFGKTAQEVTTGKSGMSTISKRDCK